MPQTPGRRPTAESFEAFVAVRGDALWRTAWLLTGDRHLAEDLVQTALVKAWPKWDRVGSDGFEAYVRRILVTTYIAWWRRRWNGEQPTSSLPETTIGDESEAAVRRHDLMAALARLPRGQRAVVVLRWLEDLSEAQTADQLGCSVGTVKSQASRAMTTLRTVLSDPEGARS
jgi:RNA polymerase sigma-70 factor (sigma-E family)